MKKINMQIGVIFALSFNAVLLVRSIINTMLADKIGNNEISQIICSAVIFLIAVLATIFTLRMIKKNKN